MEEESRRRLSLNLGDGLDKHWQDGDAEIIESNINQEIKDMPYNGCLGTPYFLMKK